MANDSAAAAELIHDRSGRDLTPHLARAREDILESLMAHGQWPVPASGCRAQVVDLDIASYLNDLKGREYDEFVNSLWSGDEARDRVRFGHEARIRVWIPERLVEDRAAAVAAQADEDEAVERDYAALGRQS